jgi:hypothetical protein
MCWYKTGIDVDFASRSRGHSSDAPYLLITDGAGHEMYVPTRHNKTHYKTYYGFETLFTSSSDDIMINFIDFNPQRKHRFWMYIYVEGRPQGR